MLHPQHILTSCCTGWLLLGFILHCPGQLQQTTWKIKTINQCWVDAKDSVMLCKKHHTTTHTIRCNRRLWCKMQHIHWLAMTMPKAWICVSMKYCTKLTNFHCSTFHWHCTQIIFQSLRRGGNVHNLLDELDVAAQKQLICQHTSKIACPMQQIDNAQARGTTSMPASMPLPSHRLIVVFIIFTTQHDFSSMLLPCT